MLKKETNTTLMKRDLIAPLLVIGFLSPFVFVFTAWASGIASADVIALANSSRTKAGLAPLTENVKLSASAKNKAEDMLKNDYFAHTSPKGITPWFWIKQAGYQYKSAGENLAINYTDAKEQHNAWMKSASHRDNILNAQYQEIGVAVVKGKIDGQESVVTVEFFGTPVYAAAGQPAPIPPTMAPAPADIKGVETQAEMSVPDMLPILPEHIALEEKTGMVPPRPMTWLDISWLAFIALVGFSLMAPAMAFLFRAYRSLHGIIRMKNKRAVEAIQNSQSSLLEHHLRI